MTATTGKVILSPLPKLLVYDHCPFCVRVRLAFGIKKIKHELYFLANDDVNTPTSLVGKKIAPIFTNPEGISMPESLDIIAKVDSDPKYGPTNFFRPLSGRSDLKKWQASVADANRILQRPRYMRVPLPEFHQEDGRDAFVKNHPVPPFEKEAWKSFSNEDQWKYFEKAYEASFKLIDETNKSLLELEELVFSSKYCTEGGLSLDDIDLWSRLRSLTLVKGIIWPSKLREYMNYFSKLGDIPLYDSMAC
jgi:GrxB family glutaredoxin